MAKKTKIILLIVLILIIILGGVVWYFYRDNERILHNVENNNDTKTERLKDPNLLYASFFWSGLCVNKEGEEGGCYTEMYLYSDGEFVKKMGWTGLDDKIETEPTIEKQLSGVLVEEVKKQIRDASLMTKKCSSQQIIDAGWDYQINLDGAIKSFHNPPEECNDIFDNIDQMISSASQNTNYEISNSQNEGTLGDHNCLSRFQVKRNEEYSDEPEILALDFFQSFGSGAFFGKIKNYQPELNKKFAFFINQLMKEKKVMTYLHLEANVCMYHQDLYNPENGAGLDYYIEHYYCTNHCQTGKYEIRVDLDANGNFVGYRKTENIY